MNGKGDKRRPGDENAYRKGHDRIFTKKPMAEIVWLQGSNPTLEVADPTVTLDDKPFNPLDHEQTR